MGISSKTRKMLRAKSGNRWAICKIELCSKAKSKNDFNIGEECHIISSKPNGPRYKPNLENYDTYDNLILLCRNHYKEIDELSDTYTEELLRYIKLNHENWVKTTLDNSINEEKIKKPKFLRRITSGKELLDIISNSHGYRIDYDEVDNKEDADYIGGMLQLLTDCGDISEALEIYDRIKISFQLNELLKDLENKGYFLFGEKSIEKIKVENRYIDNWKIAIIIIKKKDSNEIINFKLNE